jgi:transposase
LLPTRDGCRRVEQPRTAHLGKNRGPRLLRALEPSGIYWQALSARLHRCGAGVGLGHCQAGCNQRKPLPDGTSHTDEKEADSGFDLLRQGPVFLPGERDPALQAASRVLRRHLALKTRVSQLRNPLRAALHLACPAWQPLRKALPPPPARRFLQAPPPPAALLRHGGTRGFAPWPPRQRCGQWRPEPFHRLYALAQASSGLQAPARLDACESPTLAGALVEALPQAHLWLAKASALLAPRADDHLLVPLPRSGRPTAAALLTAMGAIHADQHGQQLVKRAGLALRCLARGSRLRTLPQRSHGGRASRRDWLSPSALRRSAHAPPCKADYPRRKHQAPGQGAGQRARIAGCDNPIRMLSRLLTAHAPYAPNQAKSIAQYSAAPRKAASA